ncbi:MAG: hypothetical protein WCK77_25175 [Verrucomicrobiota bacterium]
MILSQGKYPFGTIITRMSDGEVEFVISTAKEGVLKGLTTYVQLPPGNNAAKVFYMPSMNTQAIHSIHNMLVESIEENLKAGTHLAILLVTLLESLRDSVYTREVVIDNQLTEYATRLQYEAYLARSVPEPEPEDEEIAAADVQKHTQDQNFDAANEPGPGKMEVAASDFKVGENVFVDGEEMKVTAIDNDGAVTLQDGTKFGKQKLESGDSVYVEMGDGVDFADDDPLLQPEDEPEDEDETRSVFEKIRLLSLRHQALRPKRTEALNDYNNEDLSDFNDDMDAMRDAQIELLNAELERLQARFANWDDESVTDALPPPIMSESLNLTGGPPQNPRNSSDSLTEQMKKTIQAKAIGRQKVRSLVLEAARMEADQRKAAREAAQDESRYDEPVPAKTLASIMPEIIEMVETGEVNDPQTLAATLQAIGMEKHTARLWPVFRALEGVHGEERPDWAGIYMPSPATFDAPAHEAATSPDTCQRTKPLSQKG